MPQTTNCEICGTRVDTRGLSGHMQSHEPEELAAVIADGSGGLQMQDAENGVSKAAIGENAVSEAMVDENAVTVRATHEVVISDQELKREVVEELKNMVRNTQFQR